MSLYGYPERCESWTNDYCYNCGDVLPTHPENENGPEQDGFCSSACQRLTAINDRRHAKGKPALHIPHGLFYKLFAFLRDELGAYDEDGWSRRIYKGTNCGAWLAVQGPNEVRIGSIVEGVDYDCQTEELVWPFTHEQFWDAVQNVEEEASSIWNDANEGE